MSEKTTSTRGRKPKTPAKEETSFNSEELMNMIQQQGELIKNLQSQLESNSKDKPTKISVPEPPNEEKIYTLSDLKDLGLPEKVSINHFVDPIDENMGLRDMGKAVLDGAGGRGGFEESLGYKTVAGVKYYLTGLEEPSRNIEAVKDPQEKRALIKRLRQVKDILSNILGVDLSSRNYAYWSNVKPLKVRTPVYSLSMTNPDDVIMYYAILGGAIDSVAPSLEVAQNSNRLYKHYLHVDKQVEKVKIGIKRQRNKAISVLEDLYEKGETDKLLMLTKVVLPIQKGFTKKDPIDRLYNDLNDYINGINVPGSKSETPQIFMRAAEQSLEDLTRRAVINDGVYYKMLRQNQNKEYYNTDTHAILGRNISDVVAYYMDETNHQDFSNIYKRVDAIWNNG
jgi:hypothetical protein